METNTATGRLPSIPGPLEDIFEDFLLTVPALTADSLFIYIEESSTYNTAAPPAEAKLKSAGSDETLTSFVAPVEPEPLSSVTATKTAPKLDSTQPLPNWAPVQEKRPVDRPITYKGDPDSPLLSEDQRRQVKRRMANRISASRVRQRRQDECAELRKQLAASLQRERALMEHIRATECQVSEMQNQIQLLQKSLALATPLGCSLVPV
ncbi:hypothetical protein WJX73_009066 [Symbiochloris irregularis]|uniref:BZIP domain-containing protein n=1 Tax=Symbiochloris irregularis TaxID=706552 RepID=A0AAW1NMM4_9CHLO